MDKSSSAGPVPISHPRTGRPLKLRIYPDSVLRYVCDPVDRFDSSLQDLLQDMLDLMRERKGIGLAGPQVGVLERLFVCEVEGPAIQLVNPQMIHRFGGTAHWLKPV